MAQKKKKVKVRRKKVSGRKPKARTRSINY